MFVHARPHLAVLIVAMTQFLSFPASATLADLHYDVQVTDIEVVNDGTYNAMYVRGAFTPALPCPVQGFFLFPTDPYQKEVTAMLMTAKLTGRSVSFVHAYCMAGGPANGYSRGNGYVLK